MAIALELVDFDDTRRKITRIYKATLSSTYTTSGEVLDFSAATNPSMIPCGPPGYGAAVADAQIKVPNNGNGYMFRTAKGTTLINGVLRIYESGADGGDLDEISGSIPAALTDDANIFVYLTLPNGF